MKPFQFEEIYDETKANLVVCVFDDIYLPLTKIQDILKKLKNFEACGLFFFCYVYSAV